MAMSDEAENVAFDNNVVTFTGDNITALLIIHPTLPSGG